MTIYKKIAGFAAVLGGSPFEAWLAAIKHFESEGVGTKSSREKGCPKSAFVSLAQHGYVKGFPKSSDKPLSENADHALKAYELLLQDPTLRNRKSDWWRAVADAKGISRKGQNGVLDVLLALLDSKTFVPAASDTQ